MLRSASRGTGRASATWSATRDPNYCCGRRASCGLSFLSTVSVPIISGGSSSSYRDHYHTLPYGAGIIIQNGVYMYLYEHVPVPSIHVYIRTRTCINHHHSVISMSLERPDRDVARNTASHDGGVSSAACMAPWDARDCRDGRDETRPTGIAGRSTMPCSETLARRRASPVARIARVARVGRAEDSSASYLMSSDWSNCGGYRAPCKRLDGVC